jgi:hypothetical protein
MAPDTVYLKLLLCNLPEALPDGMANDFPFINFAEVLGEISPNSQILCNALEDTST